MSKPNSKANEAHLDNIHWEEARDSGYPIIDKGRYYECDGKMVYWDGQEAWKAENFLKYNSIKSDESKASELFGQNDPSEILGGTFGTPEDTANDAYNMTSHDYSHEEYDKWDNKIIDMLGQGEPQFDPSSLDSWLRSNGVSEDLIYDLIREWGRGTRKVGESKASEIQPEDLENWWDARDMIDADDHTTRVRFSTDYEPSGYRDIVGHHASDKFNASRLAGADTDNINDAWNTPWETTDPDMKQKLLNQITDQPTPAYGGLESKASEAFRIYFSDKDGDDLNRINQLADITGNYANGPYEVKTESGVGTGVNTLEVNLGSNPDEFVKILKEQMPNVDSQYERFSGSDRLNQEIIRNFNSTQSSNYEDQLRSGGWLNESKASENNPYYDDGVDALGYHDDDECPIGQCPIHDNYREPEDKGLSMGDLKRKYGESKANEDGYTTKDDPAICPNCNSDSFGYIMNGQRYEFEDVQSNGKVKCDSCGGEFTPRELVTIADGYYTESKASEGKWLEAGRKESTMLYAVKNSALMGDFEPFINLVKQGGGDWGYFEQNPNKEEILQQIDMELENLKMSVVDRGNWDALGMHQESKATEWKSVEAIAKEFTFADNEQCPECNGTGEWEDVVDFDCPRCDGIGYIQSPRTESKASEDYEVDVDEYEKTGEPVEKLPTDKRNYDVEAGSEDHICAECGFVTSDNSEYIDHLHAHED